MATYLNPGKEPYQMAVNSEIFVDKTLMIRYLNSVVDTQQRYISVSRPRRFGKTMAADMICAYYGRGDDSRSLFEKRRIAQDTEETDVAKNLPWDVYLGQFDVVRLVMTRFFKKNTSVSEALTGLQKLVIRDYKKAYPEVDYFDDGDLVQTIDDVYSTTKEKVVFVIDEWDAVFRTLRNDSEGQTEYLDFLRDLFKDNKHVALAYMTGILPIKKYGEHSALNMFDEYSMVQPMRLAEYTGFTEAEVKELCDEYEMSFDEVSKWYDGYKISDYIPIGKREEFRHGNYSGHKMAVYSPLSVVRAMQNGIVDNYWNKTESYEALAEYIRMDYDGLKETITLLMDGGRVGVNLKSYQNDMSTFNGRDDILALLIHLGYLGFEGNESQGRIDSEQGKVFIPNREILEEFMTSTRSDEWVDTFKAFKMSQELLKATWDKDGDEEM